MKMKSWDVYLRGRQINTVYFDADMSKDQVLRALINHDCFPVGIEIYGWVL